MLQPAQMCVQIWLPVVQEWTVRQTSECAPKLGSAFLRRMSTNTEVSQIVESLYRDADGICSMWKGVWNAL